MPTCVDMHSVCFEKNDVAFPKSSSAFPKAFTQASVHFEKYERTIWETCRCMCEKGDEDHWRFTEQIISWSSDHGILRRLQGIGIRSTGCHCETSADIVTGCQWSNKNGDKRGDKGSRGNSLALRVGELCLSIRYDIVKRGTKFQGFWANDCDARWQGHSSRWMSTCFTASGRPLLNRILCVERNNKCRYVFTEIPPRHLKRTRIVWRTGPCIYTRILSVWSKSLHAFTESPMCDSEQTCFCSEKHDRVLPLTYSALAQKASYVYTEIPYRNTAV